MSTQSILKSLKLEQRGALLSHTKIHHSYPFLAVKNTHYLPFNSPMILGMEKQKQIRLKALKGIEKKRWIPEVGRAQIWSMVAERPDWCLSLQRVGGGVPTTLFSGAKRENP